MKRRSLIVVAALALGLMLGLLVGPLIGSGTASAQTATTVPGGSLWGQFLDNLAGRLNINRSALDSAIVSAGTTTADQAVQSGTLTQAQADSLKARVQAGDLHGLLRGRGGPGGDKGAHSAVRQAMLDAAANTLGLSTADLTTQLRAGQTIAQIAQAKGSTEQAVLNAALAAAKTQLDQQVAAGTITQARADSAYAELQQRGAQILNGRGHGRRGERGTPATPTTPTTTPSAGA
ncbi:MAG: hypothetical protein H7Z42_15615 [Roseiflexaceae bacterium]|nr:hypothetical protein [Roseiflexaceae bacterium]